jgi:hypothetical protein
MWRDELVSFCSRLDMRACFYKGDNKHLDCKTSVKSVLEFFKKHVASRSYNTLRYKYRKVCPLYCRKSQSRCDTWSSCMLHVYNSRLMLHVYNSRLDQQNTQRERSYILFVDCLSVCLSPWFFFHVSHMQQDFRKNVFKHRMCVLIISTNFIWNNLKTSARFYHKWSDFFM